MSEGSGLLEFRSAQLTGLILSIIGDSCIELAVVGVCRPDGQACRLLSLEVDHGPVHVHEIDRRDRLALSSSRWQLCNVWACLRSDLLRFFPLGFFLGLFCGVISSSPLRSICHHGNLGHFSVPGRAHHTVADKFMLRRLEIISVALHADIIRSDATFRLGRARKVFSLPATRSCHGSTRLLCMELFSHRSKRLISHHQHHVVCCVGLHDHLLYIKLSAAKVQSELLFVANVVLCGETAPHLFVVC